MRLDVKQVVDATTWDDAVRRAGGSIFHSSIWADYVAACDPNVTTQYITLEGEHREVLGLALGFRTRSRHRFVGRFTGRLRLESAPLTMRSDEHHMERFVDLLQDFARRSGDVELSIGSFAAAGSAELLGQRNFTLRRRLEFELPLDRPEDEMWKGLDYKRRWNINKARRLGVVIKRLPSSEGIPTLRRLQAESGRRIVARKGPDIARRSWIGERDPIEVLTTSGCGQIVGAYLDGIAVSAGLFTSFNGLVYHTLSGHDRTGLEAQAPTLLLWQMISHYRAQEAERFNFGGCSMDAVTPTSPEHGVYVYKKSLGGRCLECTGGTKILRRGAHRMHQLLARVRARP